MSLQTKAEAMRAAKKLVERCGPAKRWHPHVWENLGWHYSAVNGPNVELHEFAPDHYWLDIKIAGNPQLIGEGKTPAQAIADARAKVQRWRGKIAQL